jgi:hypothetical protein
MNEVMTRELPVCECEHCHGRFRQARKDQRFCSVKCQRAWHHKMNTRGAKVYPLLYEWRRTRGKSANMTEICRILDAHIREDRESRT